MTREQWLQDAVDGVRSRFSGAGYPLPQTVHVSVGFPSRGALGKIIGQCWAGAASKDGNCQVFISPLLGDPFDALDTLAHELAHVVTPGAGHRGKFVTACKALGLTKGKPKSVGAGPELAEELRRLNDRLGKYPHPALVASSLPKPQGTRLLKVSCPECGYVVRVTRQWLDQGAPCCSICELQFEEAV